MQKTIIETQKQWVDVKMKYWEFNQKRSEFEDKIWMDYEILQLMDRMSQLVSLNTPEDKTEAVLGPVRKTQNSEGIQLQVQLPGDGSLVVKPFPFSKEFETTVKLRKIEDKQYSSHAELKEAIEQAPFEKMKWKIRSK